MAFEEGLGTDPSRPSGQEFRLDAYGLVSNTITLWGRRILQYILIAGLLGAACVALSSVLRFVLFDSIGTLGADPLSYLVGLFFYFPEDITFIAVSLAFAIFAFVLNAIIYGAVIFSIALKAYYDSGNIFYIYCGIIGAISLISFNLLQDSKYRAFFIELAKYDSIKVRREGANENSPKNIGLLHRIFSVIHKTCEIHVMINTITVLGLLQLIGLRYLILPMGNFTWPQVVAFYYAVATLFIAVAKTTFIVMTRKPDQEFKEKFLVD